jgi:hypothetical protein
VTVSFAAGLLVVLFVTEPEMVPCASRHAGARSRVSESARRVERRKVTFRFIQWSVFSET